MSETDKLKIEMYDDVVKEKNKEYIELSCRFRETCNDIKNKDKEIERLHSIIKEVKEYIEEHIEWEVDGEEGVDYTAWINFKGTSYEYFVKDLLEILDKENK